MKRLRDMDKPQKIILALLLIMVYWYFRYSIR